jgi:hypothetical protein
VLRYLECAISESCRLVRRSLGHLLALADKTGVVGVEVRATPGSADLRPCTRILDVTDFRPAAFLRLFVEPRPTNTARSRLLQQAPQDPETLHQLFLARA